ncbi:hypothetical protein GCM10025867_25510 [Frondihabitans sucicola]|uniref:Uncharacterized protein n=1 Tax=Frondihabitans sucicola TaxID=1268041 RepID=A0ABM8GPE1_9MICO|nr:hypothetical protein [Frondihabitans sucicola]BDZ50310.1 hypothetical protein GCM10025867_25510 [Frondihabitans sucicola]
MTSSTPAGLASAASLLGTAAARFGTAGTSRLLVVANGSLGPVGATRGPTRGVAELRDRFGQGSVVPFPRDEALALGGRIPLTRLSLSARRGQTVLAQRTGELLAMHRRAR